MRSSSLLSPRIISIGLFALVLLAGTLASDLTVYEVGGTGFAQQSSTVFVPAGGPTALSLIKATGIQVETGDVLQFSATGLANGCPGHPGCIFRDANGAPAGSQQFSGPLTGGNPFQLITNGVANFYSLVGAISNASNNAFVPNSQWFAIGTGRQLVADRTGELVLALGNSVYSGGGLSDGQGGFTVTVTKCETDLITPETITVAPGSSNTFKVQVKDCVGLVGDASIRFDDNDYFVVPLVQGSVSDGHNHSDANKPRLKGTFGPGVGPPEPGSFFVKYDAPKASGLVKLTIHCALDNGQPCAAGNVDVKVKVGGLQELTQGTNYTLVGDLPEHPSNHYGISEFNAAVKELANTYSAAYGGDQLAFNDMSLAFGGVFDLNFNWLGPHSEHAKGLNLDLRMSQIPPSRRPALKAMIIKHNMGILVEKPPQAPYHWHLRYGERDCEVLQSGNTTVPCDDYNIGPLRAETSDVQVQASVQTSYDPGTRLYTYSYSFSNDAGSPLEVSSIGIPLNGSFVLNATGPVGWTASVWEDNAGVEFAATEIGDIPPNYVDDGNLLPSPYQIRPGQNLDGFSFKSPYPPGTVDLFAQGFKPLPSIVDGGGQQPSYFDGSFSGTTTGPMFPLALYPNKIDEPWSFVRQHYRDFLNREPDTSGLVYWAGQILQCGSDPACVHNKRVDVSNAFFFELEFQQTGAYVYRLYRAAYGNAQPFPNPHPDSNFPGENLKLPAYAVFAQDRAQVVGGSNLAQKQLSLANAFVQRPEFLARYPASLTTAAQFVDAVVATMQTDIGVNLSSQRDALINLFSQAGGGDAGRGAVLYRLADDNLQTNPINNRALIDAEYNRAFVFTQYAGYLRRNADMAGFLFWLGQVNSGPLRDVPKQHAMVCSFITSVEYQLRFSSVITHSNAECPQ
jgi:hypothetical protein